MGIEPEGDEVSGRKLLMWNNDVEISLVRPSKSMEYFFRNGEGDEVYFVHEGSGTLHTTFGDLPYSDGDYIVIPRGTTYKFEPSGPQRYLLFETPGADRDPEALPEPVRPADGARALLPPGHPPAHRAPDVPRPGRLHAQDPRP